MKKSPLALAVSLASVLVLAGCATAPTTAGTHDGRIQVLASTNVYGSLAEQIGGDRVDVTSIVASAAQDPHSYEATARDRLAAQGAQLVIENGGGYDAFMDELLDGSSAVVVTAAEFSHDFPGNEGHDEEHADEHDHDDDHGHDHAEDGHDHDDDHEGHSHIEGFNEHVWFDPHTMIHVIEGIAEELAHLDPEGANDFAAAAGDLIAELEGFEADLVALNDEFGGTGVFITEPLPGYLAAAAGLDDLTPEGFATTVEEGNDVAPAVLLQALDVIAGGEVRVLLTNAQTGGSETERVEQAATDAGIPVVAFTELLEDGSSYAEWMQDAIQNLAAALRS